MESHDTFKNQKKLRIDLKIKSTPIYHRSNDPPRLESVILENKLSRTMEDIDFRKYRDLAPEFVDDESLLYIISENHSKEHLILDAINNLWNTGHLDNSAWKPASKAKKNVASTSATSSGGKYHSKSSSGSGYRDNKDRNGKSQPGKPVSKAPTDTSKVHKSDIASKATKGTGSEPAAAATSSSATVSDVKHKSPPPQPQKQAVAAVSTVNDNVNKGLVKSAWSENLLQKLKQQAPPPAPEVPISLHEIEKVIKPELVEVEEESSPSPEEDAHEEPVDSEPVKEEEEEEEALEEPVTQSESIVEEVTPISTTHEPIISLESLQLNDLTSSSSHMNNIPTTIAESAVDIHKEDILDSKKFLNLGKWETSDITLGSSFQFGSFGMDENESHHAVAKDTSAPTASEQTWSTTTSDFTSAVNLAPAISAPTMSSLFQDNKVNTSSVQEISQLNQSRIEVKSSSIPPGLDSQSKQQVNITASTATTTPQLPKSINPTVPTQIQPSQQQQMRKTADIPIQTQSTVSQPYMTQPPGIATSVAGISAGRPNPMVAAGGPTMMTPFPFHNFDLNTAPQYMHPYASTAASTLPTATPVSTPATSVQSATTNTPSQTTQAAQQQPSYAPPPGISGVSGYGYYAAAPYFANQYYFNQPGFYNQGRNPYARPAYPTDPYAAAGGASMYQEVYTGAQYGDSSANYGMMPMHQSLGQQSSVAAAASANTATSSANQVKQKPNTAGVQQQTQPDAVNAYPYGGYPGRTTADQSWQQYPNPAQSWNNMMFSNATMMSAQQQAYNQQSAQQPQQQQQQGGGGGVRVDNTQRNQPNASTFNTAAFAGNRGGNVSGNNPTAGWM